MATSRPGERPRFPSVPDSLSPDPTENKTVSAEAIVVQAMQEVPDAVQRYAQGDAAAFSQVQTRAEELARGEVSEADLKNALASKFGDGI